MKRWPVIRHIRWLYLSWCVQRWTQRWAELVGCFPIPNENDLRYLDAVWKGER